MKKPIISINLSARNYSGLVDLGNTVIAGLTANLNFPTPSPGLAALQTAVDDVTNAIAKWGPKGNRGSHADMQDLRNKALTLSQMLKSESQYVQNTAQGASGNDYPAMAAMILSSGFKLKGQGSPQGVLEAVRNFHAVTTPQVNPNQVKLRWMKPLNVTAQGNVKDYRIFRGTTDVFSAAAQVAASTKTSYIDTNETGATVTWYYWVVAVNSAGDGTVSEVVKVGLFSI